MTPLPPIFVAKLFRPLCAKLHELLHSLSIDEWHRPTTSSERCVKDIVAHLLDGSLRRLSLQRDEYFSPHRAAGQQQNELLVDFLNRLNHEWEIATRRLSPNVLLRMLEDADSQLAELFESLDPFATAIFPVA